MTSPSTERKPSSIRARQLVLVALGSFVLGGVALAGLFVYSRHPEWFLGGPDPLVMPTRPGGWDLSQAVIPTSDLRLGGPPKDGIPALTHPKFTPAEDATYLAAGDRVIGIAIGDSARAYPLKILNYHEIVNDTCGDQAVAVTYCPLCDSAAVFDRRDGERVREFGVSGLLYNSNVLMYDRGSKTASLWSQMMKQSVTGPLSRTPLRSLPCELTTWGDWRGRYPRTRVLAVNSGHDRAYDESPYEGYFDDDERLAFSVDKVDPRLRPKAPVLGVWTDKVARAFPLSAFDEQHTRLDVTLGEHTLKLAYNPRSRSLRVVEADDGVQWLYALWFAWYAFHPNTELHAPAGSQPVAEDDRLP